MLTNIYAYVCICITDFYTCAQTPIKRDYKKRENICKNVHMFGSLNKGTSTKTEDRHTHINMYLHMAIRKRKSGRTHRDIIDKNRNV